MKNFMIFLCLFSLFAALPLVAKAEEQGRKVMAIKKQAGSPYSLTNLPFTPTNLVPMVEEKDLQGNPRGAIPDEVIKKIDDRCLAKVPERFTPDAHHTYCACTSAATQGTVRLGELAEMQKKENRVIGNKTFENYVQNVVAPCMEMPVEEIEYLYCVLYKSNDLRISYIPTYCKCVGKKMRDHVKKLASANILLELANTTRMKSDPIQALWKSEDYQRALENSRDSCALSYLKRDTPFKQ